MEEEFGFILKNILFPVIVAILGTHVWNWFMYKKKEERERHQKLYGPLILYLMMLKVNKEIREKLTNDTEKRYQEMTSGGKDGDGNLLSKMGDERNKEVFKPSINEWWCLVRKIKGILESNSQYIKEEHLYLVKRFMSSYIQREMVYGKDQYKDTSFLFTSETIKESSDTLQVAIKELQQKIVDNN